LRAKTEILDMKVPGGSINGTFVRLLVTLVLALAGGNVAAQAATRHIVLLFDERVELPGLAALEADFVRTLRANTTEPIEIYRESMDLSRFGSATYESFLRDVLKTKYDAKKIDVVVGIMAPALDFLLKFGEEIFPDSSIVFCGLDKRQLGERTLPAHVRGVLLKRDFGPTVEVALRLHPSTEKVVVISGWSQFDTNLHADARAQFKTFEDRATFSDLNNLPLPQLLDEVARLSSGTIVLFVSLFRDAAGNAHVPHDVVSRISQRSAVPVYGFVDQYLGQGIVGGKLYSLATHGREAAYLASNILKGSDVGATAISETASQVLAFDGRQLRRWNIAERDLPAGSEIRYQQQTFWRAYQTQIGLIVAAILLQAGLISILIYERHHRQNAEALARQRMADLARVNRFSTAGALTATIAHELNQPLGAILINAEAAALLMDDPVMHKAELKDILADIRRDDHRAGEIIAHARSLLKKAPFELKVTDLNEIAIETVRYVDAIARARRISLTTSLTAEDLPIRSDAIHIQQVIMNLLLNAADAMEHIEPSMAAIELRTERDGKFAVLSVLDTGPGIPPDKIASVFDPFFSTKSSGMGLGLSIARSIVETHGGQIRATNRGAGGAMFQIRLPIAAGT
jgi:signal transduction histidine kinase